MEQRAPDMQDEHYEPLLAATGNFFGKNTGCSAAGGSAGANVHVFSWQQLPALLSHLESLKSGWKALESTIVSSIFLLRPLPAPTVW